MFTPKPLPSKLPEVGTTIFTVVSQWAQVHGAINLGQGFPDFDCAPALIACVNRAMMAGHNQYPPMSGVPLLQERIAEKMNRLYGHAYHPINDITITAGATQAIFTAINALVHEGDEVVLFTPCFDSYLPAIKLCGGVAVCVALDDEGRPPREALRQAINSRTKLIIVNTPNNPLGRVWRREDWLMLADLLRDHDALVLSDEVYEHMVYDGRQHESACQFLPERTLVVSSFGKTYHVTGWKVGFICAPQPLMTEYRKVHQFNVFTVNSAVQIGLAEYMVNPEPYLNLPTFYQRKRDYLTQGLIRAGFVVSACEGTYFLVATPPRHPLFEGLDDMAMCRVLTEKIGVAAIPMSAFEPLSGINTANQTPRLRFCFAKKEETLDQAIARLLKIKNFFHDA